MTSISCVCTFKVALTCPLKFNQSAVQCCSCFIFEILKFEKKIKINNLYI